jgi:hypothetical protein
VQPVAATSSVRHTNRSSASTVSIARSSATWLARPCTSVSKISPPLFRFDSARAMLPMSRSLMPRMSVPTLITHAAAAVSRIAPDAAC